MIKDIRKWMILGLGVVFLIAAGYLLYADLNNLWEDELNEKWIIGTAIMGIIMIAQPTLLKEIFQLLLGRFKSPKK